MSKTSKPKTTKTTPKPKPMAATIPLDSLADAEEWVKTNDIALDHYLLHEAYIVDGDVSIPLVTALSSFGRGPDYLRATAYDPNGDVIIYVDGYEESVPASWFLHPDNRRDTYEFPTWRDIHPSLVIDANDNMMPPLYGDDINNSSVALAKENTEWSDANIISRMILLCRADRVIQGLS